MTKRTATFLIVALVILTVRVGAHHGTAPVYDHQGRVTIQGVVTEFRFINPHTMMSIDVIADSGSVVKWTVEFQGRLNLSDMGWTEKTITLGERLTVTGHPTHTGSARMLFQRIVRSDGSELVTSEELRRKEIEAVRRQRRERGQ